MRFSTTRCIAGAAIVAMALMTIGCVSTRINFEGPPGTVLFIDGKSYHLPAQAELARPAGDGGSKRYDVSLATTVQSREVRAKGHIDLFGFSETDVDKLATNTCVLDDMNLLKILDGSVVIFRGQSASRQPLYDLTLAK
jgi:hypothetical protein